MTPSDRDCGAEVARAVAGMVGHLLREEERRELEAEVIAAVKAVLARRDNRRVLAAEPSPN